MLVWCCQLSRRTYSLCRRHRNRNVNVLECGRACHLGELERRGCGMVVPVSWKSLFCWDFGVNSLVGIQKWLSTILIARCVMSSIITHHSTGLKVSPKMSRKYIVTHIDVMHMYFTASKALRCILRKATSKSILHRSMTTNGYFNLIA